METSVKALPLSVFVMALNIFRNYRADWERYEEGCEAYRLEGFRPHYCFHGTNLWTDYDNICGGCEDYGNNFDPRTYAELALDEAKGRYAKMQERTAILVKLMEDGAPSDAVLALGAWATETLKL